MSKDKALEKWLEEGLPKVPLGTGVSEVHCRAAWHAAVKHTLEHVANNLNKQASKIGGLDVPCANVMRNLAVDIVKMKP